MLIHVWLAHILFSTNTLANTVMYHPIRMSITHQKECGYCQCVHGGLHRPRDGTDVNIVIQPVLWYGKKMSMSVLNPNQMRHNGLVVSDDPTDHDRVFGITGENFTIPFDIDGTMIFFT